MKYLGKAITICLMASVVVMSCKKSKDKPAEQEGKKVSKIQESQDTYTTFEYDANKLLSKVTFADVGISDQMIITRNAQKKISEVAFNQDIRYVYIYSGESIDTVKVYFGPGLAGALKFHYTNGRLASEVLSIYQNNAYVEQTRLVFTYSGADITEIVRENSTGTSWQLSGKYVYSNYDQHNNPLYPLRELGPAMFPLGISVHNPAKLQEYDNNNALEFTTDYTYTYDGDGNVTQIVSRETETGQPATTKTTTFTYLP